MRHVTVTQPGLLTTVQDLGRWGWQDRGVPVAGPMDPWAHRRANVMVANRPDAATLEITLRGPEIVFDAPAHLALCGGLFPLAIDGRALAPEQPHEVPRGGVVRVGDRMRGARAYLAVDGGFDVPVVLGSRATDLASGLGGLDGRPLRAGDRLALGASPGRPAPRRRPGLSADVPDGGARVRILPGPHASLLDADARARLGRARFRLDAASNRMGYRLSGPSIALGSAPDLLSGATAAGALQLPPGGGPILLMADRQTTGGYPIVACVIAADFGLAGQLVPGDWLELAWCDPDEARDALVVRERALETIHD